MLAAFLGEDEAAAGIVSASATPPSVSTAGATSTFTGPDITALPSGGTGYTYAWTIASSDTTLVALSPTAATTQPRFSGILAGSTADGVLRCTITDTATSTTAFVDVPWSHTDTRTP
jgi:hypothetical protein